MFSFASPRRTRRPSLTPMIDVVFLLLVFFMLASQFGRDSALPMAAAGRGQAYSGPPRMVDVGADNLRLNGVVMSAEALVDLLRSMAGDDDMIILRGDEDTTVQRLVDVSVVLQQSGFMRLALVE
ncbi:biopolymer transport protein ExbD [Thalassovita gelatinovora]|uniref:Biopolymer transport protein ExbD n=1 Tax=Thalassovita gelatinovora TaxID=53501 RepID=A0A0P1FH59_THAGE|nr:biopolymer transporter ExbD [Thalassovita gelatinovora]CUH67335.1 biopolymer transport protein ExbD [Thalassovita gelatinovora]SEP76102.1 biopolymer transport protein ExbD [Thalassovita gelatinovora]